MKITWPITWTSKTVYVDMDTGEQITKHNALNNYIIIKTDKHAKLNANKTAGRIEYTRRCKKDLKLF